MLDNFLPIFWKVFGAGLAALLIVALLIMMGLVIRVFQKGEKGRNG